MCNLYANIATAEAMRRLFQVSDENDRLGNAPARPAIFPKGEAPVVRLDEVGNRELIDMRWGFLTPAFSKKDGSPIKPRAWNNARDDKLQKSNLWRASFHERRCLVPASSFNETKGQKPATDYWFGLATEDPDARPLFAFAGMWRREQSELRNEAENGLTHTIVTTEANDLVRPIHAKGRMPVILEPPDYETWLSGSIADVLGLLSPLSPAKMRIIKHGIDERADSGADL